MTKLYKTMPVAIIAILAGLFKLLGIDIVEEQLKEIANSVADVILLITPCYIAIRNWWVNRKKK